VVIAAAFASGFSGCATRLASGGAKDLPTATRANVANPLAFELSARVAVSHDGKGETFTLEWQRSGGEHVARVLTPLGTQVAELRVSAAGATLDRGRGDITRAVDEATIFGELFGVRMTLAELADWLHPRDAAVAPGGWAVEPERSAATGRVERLTATRSDAGVFTRVRVVVDEYRAK
jgi:outer membrane biogenesis lipoprotein LolB